MIFYKVELVTRKKNFYKHFRVSNSKCDVILRNSDSQIDFVTREFRTSSLATLQESGNFSEVVERLYKSLIDLDKNLLHLLENAQRNFPGQLLLKLYLLLK